MSHFSECIPLVKKHSIVYLLISATSDKEEVIMSQKNRGGKNEAQKRGTQFPFGPFEENTL